MGENEARGGEGVGEKILKKATFGPEHPFFLAEEALYLRRSVKLR
jgi:hypothetical protein